MKINNSLYQSYVLLPGKDEGLKSTKEVGEYMEWREQHKDLLEKFVDAGGEFDETRKILVAHGDLLVDVPHCNTYLMLSCLEEEMANNSKKMYKCAQQSQMLSHITELARSFQRPPRDIVYRWFEKVADNENARAIYERDVDDFAKKVKGRAIEKFKELED